MEERAKKIKLLILDVDGVLTEGHIIYDNFGDELKCFNVQDGLGMFLLNNAGIRSVIITAKKSRVVKRRAHDMRVAAVYSNHDKLKVYQKVLKKFRVKDEEVCFIGDELLDLPLIKRVGLAVAPPNAVEDVKKLAHYVTQKHGGRGAVREVIEIILKSQGLWDKTIERYII
ncbi:MAG: HAD-IIIA family hydrolase [Candidatus Omnitrophica bacterium]|nr:HAD-IIIA family hydrolase [Candidatus Omnitrophota bacterium]MBU4148933.1 HAD-IIIA family hydrolase [Candidatus Omnitrophota bacterium]